ncbi:hypothetical protein ASA1KI_12260 [Opitutales bacterium ASA1]|uniref:hypothetical protein n=1 Tax=Congregicoccus parvus TaxID=3081749 RepID=UPI002B2D13E8|nr:hypothetical protein ASA1KI_12260 [Opitutales bacterium ASA1]
MKRWVFQTLSIVAAVGVAGTVAGYFFGRYESIRARESEPVVRDAEEVRTIRGAEPSSGSSRALAAMEEVARIAAIEDLIDLRYAFERWAAGLAPEQIGEAWEAVRSSRTRWREEWTGLLLERWAELDVEEARARLAALRSVERSRLESSLFVGWARSDPEAAMKSALERAKLGPTQIGLAMAVTVEISRRDVAKAVGMITSDAGLSADVVETLFVNIIINARDSESLRAVAPHVLGAFDGEKDASRMEGSVARLFEQMALIDLDGAIAATTNLEAGDLARRAWQGLLKGWAQEDPLAAVRHAIEATDAGDLRESGLENVLGEALRYASATEMEAVASLLVKRESTQTGAWVRTIEALAATNPRVALELSPHLGDRVVRERTVSNVFIRWQTSDFDAAIDAAAALADPRTRSRIVIGMATSSLNRPERLERVLGLVDGASGDERARGVSAMLDQLGGVRARPVPRESLELVAGFVARTPGLSEDLRIAARQLLEGRRDP